MTQEEKLEEAKRLYQTANADQKYVLESLFPELKESEDEKIRQFLIHEVIETSDKIMSYRNMNKKDVLAWLEKQGEHANFFNKIQIGDKVTRNEDGVLVNLSQLNRVAKKQCEKKSTKFDDTNAKRMFIKALERVEEQNAKGYKLTDCDKNSWWEDFKAFCSEQILANSAKTCKDEQDAAWSEKYIADVFEKVGLAKIVREQSNDALTNAIQDAMTELSKFLPQQNSTWSEEDDKNLREISCLVGNYRSGDDEYRLDSWLNSIKDRLQPQPKQEWCEEDEKIMNTTLCIISDFRNVYKDSKEAQKDADKIEEWLKSLRPQNTWKPSDEQMNALNYVVNLMASSERPTENDLYYNILKSLRQQLKKLKGD